MLAPLRDHLSPKDPNSSPLLIMTKEHYLNRLLAQDDPSEPDLEEMQWIVSEDVNVEHLLNVFTSVDTDSDDIWEICAIFMRHLYYHKARPTILGPKIEALSDSYHFKPECLFWLAQLFYSVGNYAECKQLLIHTLELWKDKGDAHDVAGTLVLLASTSRLLWLPKEGIEQAEEALGIYRQLNDLDGQATSLRQLARLFLIDNQLDSAEEATSKIINLLQDEAGPLEV